MSCLLLVRQSPICKTNQGFLLHCHNTWPHFSLATLYESPFRHSKQIRHGSLIRLKFLRLKQRNLYWVGTFRNNRNAAFCLHYGCTFGTAYQLIQLQVSMPRIQGGCQAESGVSHDYKMENSFILNPGSHLH